MSKAFTSEESEDASVAGRVPEVARPGEERPITPEGHRALVEERQRIVSAELPAAKSTSTGQDPRALEHRLSLLDATLASVKVVARVEDGHVRFGSRVTVGWEEGRQQPLTIVGPDEIEPKTGRISVESPLARALLGKGPGDEVELRLPKGTRSGTIEAID